MGRSSIWMLVLLIGLPCSASADNASIKPAVAAVKKAYKEVEAAIRAKKLTRVRLTIGNGQNPNKIELYHHGATEKDYEKDPYANPPLRPRRIVVRAVLPAVGDASAAFYFTKNGQLFFVHTRGADISGASQYDTGSVGSLRVYFHGGKPVRVIAQLADSETKKRIDLPGLKDGKAKKDALAAAAVLKKRGQELADALQVLAR